MGRVCSGGGGGSSLLRRTTSLPTWCVLMREESCRALARFWPPPCACWCCRFWSSARLEILGSGFGDRTSQQAQHLHQFFVRNRGLVHVLSKGVSTGVA